MVIHLLEDAHLLSSLAREVNLSVSSVIRIFDIVGYSHPQYPPEVLAIDEFNGNIGDEKYQGILTDTVIDILPNRSTEYLISNNKIKVLKRNVKKNQPKGPRRCDYNIILLSGIN